MTTSSRIADTGDETPSRQATEYDWPLSGNRGEIPLGLTEAERPIFGGFDAATMVLTVNVFAGVNSRDPTALNPGEPLPLDGTGDGMTESYSDGAQVCLEARFAEANNMISMYWTGWWPTLHFVVQREIISGVVLSIHITLDILGSVGIETFNVEFRGVQDMTESEGDDLVNRIRPCSDSMVGKGSTFSPSPHDTLAA